MQKLDCLADRDGSHLFEFIVFDDVIDAEVGGILSDSSLSGHLSAVANVFFDLLQEETFFFEFFDHGDIIDGGEKVHKTGHDVEDNVPAV